MSATDVILYWVSSDVRLRYVDVIDEAVNDAVSDAVNYAVCDAVSDVDIDTAASRFRRRDCGMRRRRC